MRLSRRLAGVGAVVALTLTGTTTAAFADDVPTGSLVMDYAYPGAAEILATAHVKLIAGDGHIRYADCATPPSNNVSVMKVYTTEVIGPDGDGVICFQLDGPVGWLTMEVPAVFEIRGDGQVTGAGHKVRAEVTTDAGEHSVVDVNPSGSTQVGVGTGSTEPATLLELRADDPLSGGPYDDVPAVKIDVAAHGCSGALVERQWLLTSKTCFAADGNVTAGPAPAGAVATLGRPDLRYAALHGQTLPITTLVPYPGRNLVLAKLAAPSYALYPFLVATAPPATGDMVQAAGYSQTADRSTSTRQTRRLAVAGVGAGTISVTRAAGTTASTCRGDSGGPLYRLNGNNHWEILALHDVSWQTGCYGVTETRDLALETRLDDLAGWIKDNAKPAPVTDFDNDGKADVLAYDATGTPKVYLNTSTATTPSVSTGTPLTADWTGVRSFYLAPSPVGPADLGGTTGTGTSSVWANTSTPGHPGTAAGPTQPPPVVAQSYSGMEAGGATFTGVTAVDLTGEGKTDYIGFRADNYNLCSYSARPSRPGGPPGIRGIACMVHMGNNLPGVQGARLADFDNDGKLDIVGRVGNDLKVWRNTSVTDTATFAPFADGVSVGGAGWNTDDSLAVTDVNADGRPDVLRISNGGNYLQVMLNSSSPGAPALSNMVTVMNGLGSSTLQFLTDIDGDGKADLLGKSGDELRLWHNTGTATNPSFDHTSVPLTTGWTPVTGLITPDRFF